MNCVNRGDASPSPVRPCVMRHGSIGKAGRKNQKKWRPFERLKSGAQHQISRHSELGKHQAFLANNAGVCRKTSIFSTFFPRFSTAAMRITQGRTGGGEAGSGGGRGGLDPPGWADRREIVVRKMGENEKKA